MTTANLQESSEATPLHAAGAASTVSKGLREEVREATRTEHEDLEGHMNLMRPDLTLEVYAHLLRRYHDFHAVFERFLFERAAHASAFAGFYCRDRLKASWLASDLKALHATCAEPVAPLPQERLRTLFPSEQRLLGALYVIEGSMLGGSVLAKRFSSQLGLTADTGLMFFSGYGADTRAKWLTLLQLLADFDHDSDARHEIIEGARSMFLLFKEHVATE